MDWLWSDDTEGKKFFTITDNVRGNSRDAKGQWWPLMIEVRSHGNDEWGSVGTVQAHFAGGKTSHRGLSWMI